MSVIRRLKESDCESFRARRLEGAATAPKLFRFAVEDDFARSAAKTRRRLNSSLVLGIFEDETLVAIGAVEPFPGRKLGHKWLLWGMYVTRPSRGYGERIVRALLDEARQGGARSVQLTVVEDNIRARTLYERCGFKTYAREPDSVACDDGFATELLMRLPLVTDA